MTTGFFVTSVMVLMLLCELYDLRRARVAVSRVASVLRHDARGTRPPYK